VGYPYHQLAITLYPTFWEWNDSQEQELTLVHELCHYLTEPQYLLARQSQTGRLVTEHHADTIREQTTDLISVIVWGLADDYRHVKKQLDELRTTTKAAEKAREDKAREETTNAVQIEGPETGSVLGGVRLEDEASVAGVGEGDNSVGTPRANQLPANQSTHAIQTTYKPVTIYKPEEGALD
jgi:hypothetical protein